MLSQRICDLVQDSQTICILGVPGAGKSTLAGELQAYYRGAGVNPPSKVVGMVDALLITEGNQNRLMDVYKFFIEQKYNRLIFDGWPYEDEPANATEYCDTVLLICKAPWIHVARNRARGLPDCSTGEFWHYYGDIFPAWIAKYRSTKTPITLIENIDGFWKIIDNYEEWLARNHDPSPADELALLHQVRPEEYQGFKLPWGGVVNGSDATGRITRMAMRYFPRPSELKKVVDVGCEFGLASFIMARWGCPEVIGLDNDPRSITIARQLNKLLTSHVVFYEQRGERYTYEDVDLAICFSLAHHLPSPQYLYARLMGAKRVLLELPHHKYSIVEEAAQYYKKDLVATWPSPKRDREIRLYADPVAIRYRDDEPGGIRRCHFVDSGEYDVHEGGISVRKFVPARNEDERVDQAMSSTYASFPRMEVPFPQAVESVECVITYRIPASQCRIWVQSDWVFEDGAVENVGEGFTLSTSGTLSFLHLKPWDHLNDRVAYLNIAIRPDSGNETAMQIDAMYAVLRVFEELA